MLPLDDLLCTNNGSTPGGLSVFPVQGQAGLSSSYIRSFKTSRWLRTTLVGPVFGFLVLHKLLEKLEPVNQLYGAIDFPLH